MRSYYFEHIFRFEYILLQQPRMKIDILFYLWEQRKIMENETWWKKDRESKHLRKFKYFIILLRSRETLIAILPFILCELERSGEERLNYIIWWKKLRKTIRKMSDKTRKKIVYIKGKKESSNILRNLCCIIFISLNA